MVQGHSCKHRGAPLFLYHEDLADAGYQGRCANQATCIAVEVVRRKPDQIGSAVPPRRWVVERFFDWISGRPPSNPQRPSSTQRSS